MSERFAALNANLTRAGLFLPLFVDRSYMDNLKLYEVDPDYVTYMAEFAPHLFHNKQPGQSKERKFIGIVLTIHGMDYFAPLSSFKDKHFHMPESLDFIKIKQYAVINLNNMFPVPEKCRTYVDISKEKDRNYKLKLDS